MFILLPLGIISISGMVYLAVSRKSSMLIRIAALCALALMIIAVIVSLIMIFGTGKSSAGPTDFYQETPPEPAPPVQETNVMVLVLFIVFLITLFLLVLYISAREQRKSMKEKAAEEEV